MYMNDMKMKMNKFINPRSTLFSLKMPPKNNNQNESNITLVLS